MSRFSSTSLISGLLASTAMVSPACAANACDALYNASIKTFQTPHRVYSITTIQGKRETGEAILAGGVEYVLLHGKWKSSRMTPQDMTEAAQDKLKTHPDTCTLIGDQSVNGQSVSVYKVHSSETGADQQVRLLKSDGLIQGGTATLADGIAVETRYEYDNVQPPTGVQ